MSGNHLGHLKSSGFQNLIRSRATHHPALILLIDAQPFAGAGALWEEQGLRDQTPQSNSASRMPFGIFANSENIQRIKKKNSMLDRPPGY